MVFNQIGPSTRPPPLHIVSSHGPESAQLFHTIYMYILELACNKAPPPFFCQVDRETLFYIQKIYGSENASNFIENILKLFCVNFFLMREKVLTAKFLTISFHQFQNFCRKKYVQILMNRQKVKLFWMWEIVHIQWKFRQ